MDTHPFEPEDVATALATGFLKDAAQLLGTTTAVVREYMDTYPVCQTAYEEARLTAVQTAHENAVARIETHHARHYEIEDIATALQTGFIAKAAKVLGCAPITIRRAIEEYPQLKEVWEDARQALKDAWFEEGLENARKLMKRGNVAQWIYLSKAYFGAWDRPAETRAAPTKINVQVAYGQLLGPGGEVIQDSYEVPMLLEAGADDDDGDG